MKHVLTPKGRMKAESYILELKAKKRELLDAGLDTADETTLPTVDDIEADIDFCGVNEDDPDGACYYNGWSVTDNYESDRPILLKKGEDFIEGCIHCSNGECLLCPDTNYCDGTQANMEECAYCC